ncbi:PREDICTED: uncharacterized protein LOC106749855 [Dinoponera quadriceps]|uniref:Uncharacterized protein LOC106749855 n=1 Tax=Dinoponera quadriceps TaxID=609295 RepID=A0A6P3Y4Z4_DINQU|nr:PREDICTED: uncharacterized protein LOC106749855 [Dinoponera quadriceps]
MPNLKLFDVDTKIVYTLEVSEEDAVKANQDSSFATQLLQNSLTTLTEKKIKTSSSSPKPGSPETVLLHDDDETSIATGKKSQITIDDSTEKSQTTTDDSTEKDGFRWSHEAILVFLEIYKEKEHLIVSGKISMKKFWNMIASELNEKGYIVTDIQCKSKMSGLRNTYKSTKDYNGKHAFTNRRWRYFDIMDEMYQKRPWVSPTSATSNNISTSSLSEHSVNVEKTGSSKPEVPSKRLKQLEKIMAIVGESSSERSRMHKEAMIRQDKLLDILEKIHTNIDDDRIKASSCNNELPLKRPRQFSTMEKLIAAIEESTIKRSKMHEEAMARQDKLLNVLERMLSK